MSQGGSHWSFDFEEASDYVELEPFYQAVSVLGIRHLNKLDPHLSFISAKGYSIADIFVTSSVFSQGDVIWISDQYNEYHYDDYGSGNKLSANEVMENPKLHINPNEISSFPYNVTIDIWDGSGESIGERKFIFYKGF